MAYTGYGYAHVNARGFGGRTMAAGQMLMARRGEWLHEEDLRALPTIFQDDAAPDRSERFQPIPTYAILTHLEKEMGMVPVFAQAARTRIEGNEDFVRHCIRLLHKDSLVPSNTTDVTPMAFLTNANNGTGAYNLEAGGHRWVCMNGLYVSVGDSAKVRVAHTGKADAVRDKVLEGTYAVIEEAKAIQDMRENFLEVRPNDDERLAFAEAAIALRYDDPERAPVTPRAALVRRRQEDRPTDLWTDYNVVGENLERGANGNFVAHNAALGRRVQNERGTWRRASVREVTGISERAKLGRAMAVLTERFAQMVRSQHA